MGQKIALVLSGGGAKGLAQIGAIEVLEKHGFEINSISGTSIGSVIGGIYAMDKLPEFTEWALKLKKKDIITLLDFSLGKGGLIKGNKVFTKLKTFIPDMPIENFKIPYTAVAVDILNEKEVFFNSGSFYEAVRASVSIPDIFTPIKHNETLLVDGGVLNPTPISAVKRTDGDILVVINLYSKDKLISKKQNIEDIQKDTKKLALNLSKLRKKITKSILKKDKLSAGYLKLLDLTTSAMINQMSDMTIEKHKPEIVINIASNVAGLFDFDKGASLVKYGKEQAEKSIKEYLDSQT